VRGNELSRHSRLEENYDETTQFTIITLVAPTSETFFFPEGGGVNRKFLQHFTGEMLAGSKESYLQLLPVYNLSDQSTAM
jgi:hypothetical protein